MPTCWFYVDKCPFKGDCSAPSWKKAKVWGWTEKECKEQLRHHLKESILHKSLQKKGSKAVDKVVAETDVIKWEEPTDSESEKSRSRSRSGYSKPLKEEEGRGSDGSGVWTNEGQGRARVVVDRAELHSLVEDCRVVMHNATSLFRRAEEFAEPEV